MRDRCRAFVRWGPCPACLLMLLFLLFNCLITKRYFSAGSFSAFLSTYIPILCTAVGMSVVIIGGGIDLSAGSVICLVNTIIVSMTRAGHSLATAVLLSILAALAIGALNGLFISVFNINSLIVTFASSSVAGGAALWILSTPVGMAKDQMGFIRLCNKIVFGFPLILAAVILVLAAWFVIKRTPLGTYIYSVGQDEQKAFVSGIPVTLVKFSTFIFSSLCFCVGAIALTGSVGSGDASIGSAYTMNAVAACVIGGISLEGGDGEVIGSAFGVLFLGLVVNVVLAAKVSAFYQDLLSGLIILFGILFSNLINTRRKAVTKRGGSLG